jgi:glycosyltransferase involved in cell wall biosynthesis
VDFTPREWLEWARGVETQRPRVDDLRSVPWLDAVPADLPGRIRVQSAAEWHRLATCVVQAPAERDVEEWPVLRVWQRTEPAPRVVARRRAARASVRDPRVLFVSPSTGFSGPERMYVRLTNGLLDRGVDLWGLVVRPGLTAALLRPPHRERLISDGVEFGRPTFASFDYCLRVFRRIRPDLIHCNGVLAWPVLAAAQVCGLPIVQHVRTAALEGLEDTLDTSARLIAVSRFVAGVLHDMGVGDERVQVCYDGIDPEHLRRTAAAAAAGRRQLGIDANSFVLLCIARISRSKRIEVVIRAFSEVVRIRRDAQLLIVGEVEDPVYYEWLARMIVEKRLASRVRFLEAVEHIRELHAAADALMLASVREPFGNAVLEAMSMQTPVIASASGGTPEMLDDSCGTLVAPDAIREFGAALCRVASGDRELLRKAHHARGAVQRRFHIDQHVESIRRIYRDLVG